MHGLYFESNTFSRSVPLIPPMASKPIVSPNTDVFLVVCPIAGLFFNSLHGVRFDQPEDWDACIRCKVGCLNSLCFFQFNPDVYRKHSTMATLCCWPLWECLVVPLFMLFTRPCFCNPCCSGGCGRCGNHCWCPKCPGPFFYCHRFDPNHPRCYPESFKMTYRRHVDETSNLVTNHLAEDVVQEPDDLPHTIQARQRDSFCFLGAPCSGGYVLLPKSIDINRVLIQRLVFTADTPNKQNVGITDVTDCCGWNVIWHNGAF